MKIRILFSTAIMLISIMINAQVAINYDGSQPTSHTVLDVKSDTTGLLIPRMTTIQRNTLATKLGDEHQGMLVYDKTGDYLFFWNGSTFEVVTSDFVDQIRDADNDTYVDVDPTSDADYIEIATAGTNYWRFVDGRLEFLNTGASVFIGENAGKFDDKTNNGNVFIGLNAGYATQTGNENVAIGRSSLVANTSGKGNIAIGSSSMVFSQQGNANIAIGVNALTLNNDQSYNIAVGDSALYNNGDGATGAQASHNTAIGSKSMYTNATGSYNTATGFKSLYTNASGSYNTAFGYESLFANTASYNNAFGFQSLIANSTGTRNNAFGYRSLYANTSGSDNTACGHFSLSSNVLGNSNTAAGAYSLFSNSQGDYNTSIGYRTLYNMSNADHNTVIGYRAMESVDDGGYNTALGSWSLYNLTTGIENVALGYASGYRNQGGSQNTYIGFRAGYGASSNSQSGNIFLGYMAGYNEVGSNNLYIHNSDTANPLIYGDFENKELGFNALKVGVGTQNPIGKLHVHDSESSNTFMYITPANTSSGDSSSIFFGEDHDASYGMYWMYDGSGNQMELYGKSLSTIYGPHLVIDRNDGDVAIGQTLASGYKLSVDGKVICEELRVNLTEDWPDYVFKPDYELLPLNKLESFVDENGHLPNIPSSDEMDESGLEVGEMQRLMMEKIEELTLYVIQQQKEIDELKSQLSKTNQ